MGYECAHHTIELSSEANYVVTTCHLHLSFQTFTLVHLYVLLRPCRSQVLVTCRENLQQVEDISLQFLVPQYNARSGIVIPETFVR